jgi:hypothetical protein
MDKFLAYVGTLSVTCEGAKFTVAGRDTDGVETTLGLYTDLSRVPEVSNRPVTFTPEKLYDSPFLTSMYGTGVVTIQKNGRKQVLDFTTSTLCGPTERSR